MHGITKRALCVLATSCGFAGAALAQDAASTTAGQLYVKAGIGGVFVRDLDQSLTFNPNTLLTAIARPESRLTNIDNGLAAAAAIGFAYPAGTRTELEYRYSAPTISSVSDVSPFIDPTTANDVDDFTTHLLMSNVYYDFKNTSPITPFIGVGVGGAFVSNGLGESDAAFAYQGKVGFEAAMSDSLAIGVEYSYTRSRDLAFGPSDDDFTADGPVGPRADGDGYVASTVLATIRKTF